MDPKLAVYIFVGLIIGALFGFGIGSANGSPLLGAGTGALIGTAIGWFGAAYFSQRSGAGK